MNLGGRGENRLGESGRGVVGDGEVDRRENGGKKPSTGRRVSDQEIGG